ncbi:MAG: branched-chain amino acid transport system II carrier protein [Holosporales bacterium]|jgi:LIVCS family branched-chain amino acid:cation transporter|nr:branched-chain amino acid transport system II carrier protein [Holosporales bacterium]
MGNISKAVVAGFAIFSMIFGSANIVFPLIIGKDFSSHYIFAIIGWSIGAVIIPMLGYLGTLIFDGDNKKYMAPLGKYCTFALMILFMTIAGPLGVAARMINIAFGGMHIAAPEMNELIFNLAYCIVTIVLAWNPGKLVQMIGLVFTPLKFGGVAIVVVGALYFGGAFSEIPKSSIPVTTCMYDSMITGFQTADLIAAFVMGSAIFHYLKNSLPANISKKSFIKFSGLTCTVGALSLGLVYIGLTMIGAQYSSSLTGVPNESLFAQIAFLSMGKSALWFVAVVIAVCCLGTNIALLSAFTDFVHLEICKEKFNRRYIFLASGATAFVVSLLGFDQICAILEVVLKRIYPLLIMFVILRLGYYFMKKKYAE